MIDTVPGLGKVRLPEEHPGEQASMAQGKAVRVETDTFGPIEVEAERYWGAQTQRSLQNFKIGGEPRDGGLGKGRIIGLALVPPVGQRPLRIDVDEDNGSSARALCLYGQMP